RERRQAPAQRAGLVAPGRRADRLSEPAGWPSDALAGRATGRRSEAGAPGTFAHELVVRAEPFRSLKRRSRVGQLDELEIAPGHPGLKRLGGGRGEAGPDEHRQSFPIPLAVVEAPRDLAA